MNYSNFYKDKKWFNYKKYIKSLALVMISILFTGCSSVTEPSMIASEAYTKGMIYLNNNNIEYAKREFIISAQNGNAKSQAILATLLIKNEAIDSNRDKDLQDAYIWLQKALVKDEPQAILGMHYYYEALGDKNNSRIWLNKSMDKNIPISFYIKAMQLKEINEKDTQFLKYLEKSAKLNYFPAQQRLVLIATSEKNNINAYVWTSVINFKQKSSVAMYGINSKLRNYLIETMKVSEKIAGDTLLEKVLLEMDKPLKQDIK